MQYTIEVLKARPLERHFRVLKAQPLGMAETDVVLDTKDSLDMEMTEIDNLSIHALLTLIHKNHSQGLSTKAAVHKFLQKLGKNPILFGIYFEIIPDTTTRKYLDEFEEELPHMLLDITEEKARLRTGSDCAYVTWNTPILSACIVEHMGNGPYYPEELYYQRDNSPMMAIRVNNFRMLIDYIEKQKIKLKCEHANMAAYFGRTEILEYLLEADCPIDDDIFYVMAAGGDHIDTFGHLLICVEHTVEKELMYEFVKRRRKECFLYAIIRGRCDDIDAHKAAIDNGNIEFLKLANQHGALWTSDTCEYAAKRSKNGDIVKYLIENKCPYDAEEIYRCAINADNGEIMEYLLKHAVVHSAYLLVRACRADSHKCMRHIIEQKRYTNIDIMREISRHNSMKCLETYESIIGAFTQEDLRVLIDDGCYDILLYLQMRAYAFDNIEELRKRAFMKNKYGIYELLSAHI